MAQELELYKILVAIGIALVSVTITAFAIAVSLLGSEHARRQALSYHEMRRKADEKIRSGDIKDIDTAEKEVRKVVGEKARISDLWSRLHVVNIVLLPGAFFALSIWAAIQGILNYPTLYSGPEIPPQLGTPILYWQYSVMALGVGLLFLITALYAIQNVAEEARPSLA